MEREREREKERESRKSVEEVQLDDDDLWFHKNEQKCLEMSNFFEIYNSKFTFTYQPIIIKYTFENLMRLQNKVYKIGYKIKFEEKTRSTKSYE